MLSSTLEQLKENCNIILQKLVLLICVTFCIISSYKLNTTSGLERKAPDSCGKKSKSGDPTGEAEEASVAPRGKQVPVAERNGLIIKKFP